MSSKYIVFSGQNYEFIANSPIALLPFIAYFADKLVCFFLFHRKTEKFTSKLVKQQTDGFVGMNILFGVVQEACAFISSEYLNSVAVSASA